LLFQRTAAKFPIDCGVFPVHCGMYLKKRGKRQRYNFNSGLDESDKAILQICSRQIASMIVQV
jgi:hypothetical protein